ncbi:MAG: hypothetical protein KC496_21370, partial [Anaerolineae bacterium]|nr:hypothetical protein [Anaerolineae bacterium]
MSFGRYRIGAAPQPASTVTPLPQHLHQAVLAINDITWNEVAPRDGGGCLSRSLQLSGQYIQQPVEDCDNGCGDFTGMDVAQHQANLL